jgi:sugar phosphate isomerase/epimerase
MKAKVSIGSSAFAFGVYASDPLPLDRIAGRFQELGFQGIELLGSRPYGDPDDFPKASDRRNLVKKISGYGLEISNYGADFKNQSPGSGDDEERKNYRSLFTKNLEFCADLETPSIRVDTGVGPTIAAGLEYEDTRKRVAENWHECASQAEKEGVAAVWEFEPGFVFNSPSDILRMIDDVDHRNFKILFDSCHAHMCAAVGARQQDPVERLAGGEVELAGLLKNRIGYVHLIDSDNTLHDDWTSTHAPFGTGVIDFDELVEAIVRSGYDDEWWTIDLCFWPKAWEVLEESKIFMDSLLERHGLL